MVREVLAQDVHDIHTHVDNVLTNASILVKKQLFMAVCFEQRAFSFKERQGVDALAIPLDCPLCAGR
eukprot:9940835-Prorocentrum_lima.AAC.1